MHVACLGGGGVICQVSKRMPNKDLLETEGNVLTVTTP